MIVEHDALLTGEADAALDRLLASARDNGDAEFAAFIEQRRAFLRQVREAMSNEQ